MGRLKTFRNYVLWLIGFSFFTYFLTFVGFNATYKNMNEPSNLPNGVNIVMAQSTAVNGRIYGEVTSTDENNLNGKYLKVDIYGKRNNIIGTKYLKLENLNKDEPKKFAVNYTAENIKKYNIEVIENDEELEQKIIDANNLYKDIFTDEELKGGMILALVIALTFGL